MRMHYHRPFLFLQTLALVAIIVRGRVREADGLIQKPKVLQPGPSTAKWAANHPNRNSQKDKMAFPHVRPLGQRHRSDEVLPMRLSMAHNGDIVFRKNSAVPRNRVLLATALTVTLLKPRAILSLLANTLYNPYQNALVQNPLVTKVITGAILAVAGDAMAQASSGAGEGYEYDKRRALSFAVFDSCYRMFQHNMFPLVIRAGRGNFVGKLLPMLAPAAPAIEQTAIYQFLVVPCLYYPVFFAFTGFIQGLTVKQAVDRMKAQFFRCWRRNLMFWIPMQMVLFGLIAENWQIPFACLAGMVWSTILSKTAGNTKKR
ncbi:unnamed protein product [Pseudo-nitzschia multistriata]|uniref:Uncharacterized protein n=1 Tax=Pseudo-nitzschia multistriata TaxID=183589 RepID=A0A448Z141_9STRA|nr:unnamed protein product [Pseudo-nitzschia multistriata]